MKDWLRSTWDNFSFKRAPQRTIENSVKAVNEQLAETPQDEVLRNCALITDSVVSGGRGTYGFASVPCPMETEADIIPYLQDDESIMFYTFYDEDGNATPTRYVGLPIGEEQETGKLYALVNLDGGGQIPLEIKPGEKVLNRDGEVLYQKPEFQKAAPSDLYSVATPS